VRLAVPNSSKEYLELHNSCILTFKANIEKNTWRVQDDLVRLPLQGTVGC
jgi:hypothetical protein